MTDAPGLLPAMLVTAAPVQDPIAGTTLIDHIAACQPTVTTTWVDGGHRDRLVEHAASSSRSW
ncbi:hypothetical protein ACIBF1_21300 [Spirillospora sp. NPDC050679]